MGGGYYHSDVQSARQAIGASRSSDEAFDYSRKATKGLVHGIHANLNIFGKNRECCDSSEHPKTTPIVVAMDVTSSRGDDALAIYSQMPSFLGSIHISEVVTDPCIMCMAIGDATFDKAPLQVSQFESDRRIDDQLGQIWMEKGGGGTGEESYELGAFYLAKKTLLDCVNRGHKGYAFFLGDEAPYPKVSTAQVKAWIGDKLSKEISTKKIFADLSKLYHPFLIFPRASMSERKGAIDSEIRQRLEKAGGRFEHVDLRATLVWNDRTDLDLHCLTPRGEHIYFASKLARCGGELDVDRNVHGEDPKPVENIRWASGDAVRGTYKFWVNLYRYHNPRSGEIPFRVEFDINGAIETVEGSVSGVGRDFEVKEFDYEPPGDKMNDNHAAYEDEHVLSEWAKYIPEANILRVQDAASSVEVMLGVLALQSGKMNLDEFIANMKERRVDKERRSDVVKALSVFSAEGVFPEIAGDMFR